MRDTLATPDGAKNLFDGISVKLRAINKTKKQGYVAQFISWVEPITFDFHYVQDIAFDVFCTIPDSLATTLKEDEHYILDGIYAGHLTYDECVQMLGLRTSVWNPKVEIKKDGQFSSENYQKRVSLGCVLFLLDDIKVYSRRETQRVKKDNDKI